MPAAQPAPRFEPLAVPDRALAIGAHPDDIEFGAGGTLAAWARAGCNVTMAVMTDGSKGTWDGTDDPAALAGTRWQEQRAAADALGASHIEALGYLDGELEPTMPVRAAICALIRRVRPNVLLSHDPWKAYEVHPDHRATGWVVLDGAIAARDPRVFPEQGIEPHRPEWLLLWRAERADPWEDVGETLTQKVTALLAHESQHQTTMGMAGADANERVDFERRVTEWAAEQGSPVGLEAAESFKRLGL